MSHFGDPTLQMHKAGSRVENFDDLSSDEKVAALTQYLARQETEMNKCKTEMAICKKENSKLEGLVREAADEAQAAKSSDLFTDNFYDEPTKLNTRESTRLYPVKEPKRFRWGEDFKAYLTTFKYFAKAANIPDNRLMSTLLTFLDSRAQRRVKQLKLTEMETLTDPGGCLDKITMVLGGTVNEAIERQRLFTLRQAKLESIGDFVSRILDCAQIAFPKDDGEFVKKACSDVLIMGLRDAEISKFLSAIDDGFENTYQKALELEKKFAIRNYSDDCNEGAYAIMDGDPLQMGCIGCGEPGHTVRNCLNHRNQNSNNYITHQSSDNWNPHDIDNDGQCEQYQQNLGNPMSSQMQQETQPDYQSEEDEWWTQRMTGINTNPNWQHDIERVDIETINPNLANMMLGCDSRTY